MTEHRPTEPLRSEHRDLLPHLIAFLAAVGIHLLIVAYVARRLTRRKKKKR